MKNYQFINFQFSKYWRWLRHISVIYGVRAMFPSVWNPEMPGYLFFPSIGNHCLVAFCIFSTPLRIISFGIPQVQSLEKHRFNFPSIGNPSFAKASEGRNKKRPALAGRFPIAGLLN